MAHLSLKPNEVEDQLPNMPNLIFTKTILGRHVNKSSFSSTSGNEDTPLHPFASILNVNTSFYSIFFNKMLSSWFHTHFVVCPVLITFAFHFFTILMLCIHIFIFALNSLSPLFLLKTI